MSALPASRTVASFDSASAMHAATVAALNGSPFPNLGQGRGAGLGARVGGQLPWPLLKRVYARIGAGEGLTESQLARVDLATVAEWLANAYPARRYPAVLLGSSNGALTQLAAAAQIPWLPGTLLVPVRRNADVNDLDAALRFGIRHAPTLTAANPDIVVHHMHDQMQDELMAARMAYFRVKWRTLPAGYRRFLSERLQPGAPVIIVEDTSTWPVVRVSDQYLFQPGAQGGLEPEQYLRRRHTPTPDDTAPEAEWGAEPGFTAAVAAWCADHGHPLVTIRYHGPQAPSAAVATLMRRWYRERGENDKRLIVPSFILADPWLTITKAAVPFWTFFSVRPALDSLDTFLETAEPFDEAYVLPFQHGARSPGIATPADWVRALARHGVTAQFPGLATRKFPHDIAFMGRYDTHLKQLTPARKLWSSLPIDQALDQLRTSGLSVT
jgi:hypothetical protein